MPAFQFYGPVHYSSELPQVLLEGFMADGAGAGVWGDGFNFDIGGGEEEVEVGGGFVEVRYCEW